MIKRIPSRLWMTGLLTLAAAACSESGGPTDTRPQPQSDAVKFWDVLASVRWNERASGLLVQRPPASIPRAVRLLTYMSLAQYRAVLAAEDPEGRPTHPSVAAAVGAASIEVLTLFYPGDAAAFEAQLDADLEADQWPGAKNQNVDAGKAIGEAIGAAVVALAQSDGFGTQSPGLPPVGAGFWFSNGTPIVIQLFGTRPFFLSSPDQLRPDAPPAFGSDAFLDALAEVRAISDGRTDDQLAFAQFWNSTTTPFGPIFFNQTAIDLIRERRRSEREAARILAYSNAAVFDALIACFDAKFAYWFIRPSQADPAITTPLGLPNHPSYPSAHSCITSSFLTVLADAFPSERQEFEQMIADAGLARIIAGIHYRFDVEAGQEIGRGVARLALAGGLE
jgi:hypothetical protein